MISEQRRRDRDCNDEIHNDRSISNIVAQHIGTIHCENDECHGMEGSNKVTRPTNPQAIHELTSSYHAHIFPVISHDKTFSNLVRSYQSHHSSGTALLYRSVAECRVDLDDDDEKLISNFNNNNNNNNSNHTSSSSPSHGHEIHKSMSTLRSRSSPYVSHYLLQIEPNAQMPKSTL